MTLHFWHPLKLQDSPTPQKNHRKHLTFKNKIKQKQALDNKRIWNTKLNGIECPWSPVTNLCCHQSWMFKVDTSTNVTTVHSALEGRGPSQCKLGLVGGGLCHYRIVRCFSSPTQFWAVTDALTDGMGWIIWHFVGLTLINDKWLLL